MMNRLALLLACLFFLAALAPAQEGPVHPIVSHPNAIGFITDPNVFFTSLFALQYHRWMGPVGLGFSFGALFNPMAEHRAVDWAGNLGAEFDVLIFSAKGRSDGAFAIDLFGALRAGITVEHWKMDVPPLYFNEDLGQNIQAPGTSVATFRYPLGAGLGAEFTFGRRISLPILLGASYGGFDSVTWGIMAKAGLLYRF